MFYSLRPFNVLRPSLNNRETCMCIKCANIQLILDFAYCKGIVDSRDIQHQIRKFVCNDQSQKCMYRQCSQCPPFQVHDASRIPDGSLTCFQWEKVKQTGFSSTECIQVI
jgi:hypothetical protein